MCQNNLDNWGSVPARYAFQKANYTPSDTQNHSQTFQQYQRHLTKVSINEVDSFCLLLQGRINNKHAYICNVISFQLLPQKTTQYVDSREFREVLIWTDKMIPFVESDWTEENIAKLLFGFKRLAMIYGLFAVTSLQICKNENQEIKVWISKIPQKCKVDTPVSSQKDMLRSIAVIVEKRSLQLAYKINASRTMRQAIDSISSIFIYSSPGKHYKQNDFSDNKQNKNLHSTFTAFQPYKSLKTPQYINKSFTKNLQFPKSAQNHDKMKSFFPNHHSHLSSTTITRPQSSPYNHVFQQGLIRSNQYSMENTVCPTPNVSKNATANHTSPYRAYSRNLTFTPINKLGNSPNEQLFSHRMGSERVPQNDGEPNSQINKFDITIINNNVSNYINTFSKNKSSKGSKTPTHKYPYYSSQKTKSQGKVSNNTSFWLNSGKLPKNKSTVPNYFAQKMKPQSSHQQYTLDSIEDSPPQFIRNTAESLKIDFETPSNGRKDKKLYTFCNPKNPKNPHRQRKESIILPKEHQESPQKPNFFKKGTPSNSYNRSNTTQFFPSKKTNVNNNKTMEIWGNEAREKRFNSFAIDIPHEQQFSQKFVTTKSVGIDQNTSSTSSKKVELKKQLKAEFGNLFNIAEANQSPRCSYSQTAMNKEPLVVSQSKTDLMKESILKQKIKQKTQAFAQLKKQALKVLTDL